MKFWGVAMVRDEADIIEAFVRHNLTVLDGLAIFDHGSTDGTAEILAALAAEGLPVTTVTDSTTDFRQSAVISQLARQAFATHDPDFIFPLDADEFLKVPSRPQLEARLATLPRRVHAVCTWQNYVPDFAPGLDTLTLLRSARRAPAAPPPVTKAIVSRHFQHSPTVIAEGNHMVLYAGDDRAAAEARHRPLSPDACAIAHVPIRSAMQFSAKIAVGWLACLVQPDRPERLCHHWSEVFALLAAGRPLTPAMLTAIAASYGRVDPAAIEPVAVELTVDPFLADFQNRHDEVGRTDSLALVLRYAERLARRIGGKAATGAPQA
ncbi:MAG: glycosyltransferase family 2 protein [Casimicrobiaceae bacterium]